MRFWAINSKQYLAVNNFAYILKRLMYVRRFFDSHIYFPSSYLKSAMYLSNALYNSGEFSRVNPAKFIDIS